MRHLIFTVYIKTDIKKKKIEENLKEYNVGLEPTRVCFCDKLLTNNEVTLFIAIYFLLVAGEGFEPSRPKAVGYEPTEIPTSHTPRCIFKFSKELYSIY